MRCKKTRIRRPEDGPPEWCQVEVELREGRDGRLSICGSYGHAMSEEEAEARALEYWASFFEESPEELGSMVARFPDQGIDGPEAGARFVVETDGRFHGLDIAGDVDAGPGMVAEVEGCGQIVEKIVEFFPELAPYMKWHLNDMKAGCEHQEALGWGHGRDIALDAEHATPAQVAELNAQVRRRQVSEAEKRLAKILAGPKHERQAFLARVLGKMPSVMEWDSFESKGLQNYKGETLQSALLDKCRDFIINGIVAEEGGTRFRSAVFKDCLGAPCPECGYCYGTAWLKRELPAEVVAFFKTWETEGSEEPPAAGTWALKWKGELIEEGIESEEEAERLAGEYRMAYQGAVEVLFVRS